MEEIVTGEAVILDLPYARFPTRILARLIDMVIEFVALCAVLLLIGIAGAAHVLDDAAVAAAVIAGLVLVIVGYPVSCETLSRGRTVGKMALGLRVVADDGGPERFRQALVRALAGVVECWFLFGLPALITAMLSARGKRLGDVFAGTFVVRERAPKAAVAYAAGLPRTFPQAGSGLPVAAASIHPSLQPWAATLELSALPEPLAASAASYLSRFWQLNELAREQLGRQLAADVAARVSPPPPAGLASADYLYTVLAERGNRELARLMPSVAGFAGGGSPYPPQTSHVPQTPPISQTPPVNQQTPPVEPVSPAPPWASSPVGPAFSPPAPGHATDPDYPAGPQDSEFTPPT